MWQLRADGLYVSPPLAIDQNDPTILVRFCERVEVASKKVDLLSGQEKLDIALQMPYAPKRFTIDRVDIGEKRIIDALTVQGLSILDNEKSATLLKEVLVATETDAPVIFSHDTLGFSTNPNSSDPCFLWHHPIGSGFTKAQRSSMYIDPRVTEPKGSFGTWRRFIIDKVAQNPSVAMALMMGAVAPVIYELKCAEVVFENPIYVIVGESSIGKSTLLFLISSLYASPRYFINSFNATSNALSAMMAFKGVPFLADEATHTPGLDWDDVAYSIPAGKEKRRCSSDGKLKSLVEYDSAMIITTEKSLLDRTSGHSGEQARITEFELSWFDTGDEADEVKTFCSQNYGGAVEPMIALLMQKSFRKKLVKQYRNSIRTISERVAEISSGVERRIVQKLALILTAGWFLEKALRVDLHRDAVANILVKVFSDAIAFNEPVDDADTILNYIAGEIVQHQSKFPAEAQASQTYKRNSLEDLMGVRGFWGDSRCAWIIKECFRDMLKSRPEFGYRTACKKLEKAGYLVRHYGDRYFKSKAIGSMRPECYCVVFPDAEKMTEAIEKIKPTKRNLREVCRVLNDDTYGAGDYGANIIKTNSKLVLAFFRLTTQHTRMVLSPELLKELKCTATDRLFLIPIPQQKALLLSKQPLIDDTYKLRLHNSQGGGYSETRYIHTLPEMFGVKLTSGTRLILTDINIENQDEPVAVVNYENDFGREILPFNDTNPLTLNDILEDGDGAGDDEKNVVPKKLTPQMSLLLDDDKDDQ